MPVKDQPKQPSAPPPDKPPAVGDWVLLDCVAGPVKVDAEFQYSAQKFHYKDRYARVERILRRKGDPLKVGDRGLLDGKIDCWIRGIGGDGTLMVVFSQADISDGICLDEWAWINRFRFVLIEPVYEKED